MNKYIWIILVSVLVAFTPYSFAKSIEDILKDAENLIEIDQNKEALQLLKSIEPENNIQTAEHLYLLGRLYFALAKFGKADEFYMDANLLNPTEPQYKVGLSQTSFALGKLKLAERYANAALRHDPDLIDAELMLALVLNRYGKKQLAEKRFLDLIDLQPSNKLLFLTYAKFLEQSDLLPKAITTLEEFLIKHPNSPDILDYLGRLYWFSGQSDLAIEKREEAAKLYYHSGKHIMTVTITKWINSVKEKIKVEKKKEEEKKKKALPPKPKQKFIPNPGNEIEPFPDIIYEHAAGMGTGFIINEGRQVVTNKHVVEDSFKIFVRNGFGELRFATIEKLSEYDDLALLTLDTPYEPSYSLTIPKDYELRIGQTSLVMGYPLASEIGTTSPSLTQGIVSKITGLYDNPGKFLLTSKLNKGNSGGPIFSDTGELIGVAVSKLRSLMYLTGDEETDFIPEDVNEAIQINRVKRFIQSSEPVVDLPKLDLSDLYELKLPSIVIIVNLKPKEEKSEEEEINKEIEACQSDYDPKKYPKISREQFNDFCICYINGLAEIYDEDEYKHRANYNKPSDKFLNQEEKLLEYCASKVK